MAKQLQLRKGTATEHSTFTGANGEVTVDTTNKTLRVHDGSTVGGTRLATLTGGLVPAAQLPAATTSAQGIVKLNNTLTSTSTTEALTAAQGRVLGLRDFGIGQTWQDVTASRAKATTYTNSTGKPILINILVGGNDGDSDAKLFVDGIKVGVWHCGYGTRGIITLSAIVPNDVQYRLETGSYIDAWTELR